MKLADRVLAGLQEAASHAAGETVPGMIVHVPESLDVASIRRKTGQSQATFAGSIGVRTSTLQQWEHGRREPTGPARVLLAMVDKCPGIVGQVLGPADIERYLRDPDPVRQANAERSMENIRRRISANKAAKAKRAG